MIWRVYTNIKQIKSHQSPKEFKKPAISYPTVHKTILMLFCLFEMKLPRLIAWVAFSVIPAFIFGVAALN
jgi:hypothetical protein